MSHTITLNLMIPNPHSENVEAQ